MQSPLVILIELIFGLIKNIIWSIVFAFSKIFELFTSLAYLGRTGVFGMLIAFIIGSSVLLLILKFIFGASKTVIKLGLILIALLVFFTLMVSILL